jgi:uncharacterized tellurite resistance protein B-like protein
MVAAAVLAVLVLTTAAPAIAAQAFYRWVDENGVVHYTQQPPPARPSPGAVDRRAPTPGHAAAIDEALELSGLKTQLSQLPQHILAQAPQLPADLTHSERAALLRILAHSFRADAVSPLIKERFLAEFDPPRMAALLQWLRSPASRRMVQLEISGSSAAATAELQAFAASLERTPPPEERLALVRRLDEATATTDIAFETLVVIAQEIARATGGERMSLGELEGMMRSRAEVLSVIGDITLVTLLFTYRPVSDADLLAYVTAWESDVGRWFSGLWRRAYLDAIRAAARRFAVQMSRTLAPRPP